METTEFLVCADCYPVIVYSDATGLDYHYDEQESETRLNNINKGINQLAEDHGYLCSGDRDKDNGFSLSPCECCGSRLHGERFHIVAIKK